MVQMRGHQEISFRVAKLIGGCVHYRTMKGFFCHFSQESVPKAKSRAISLGFLLYLDQNPAYLLVATRFPPACIARSLMPPDPIPPAKIGSRVFGIGNSYFESSLVWWEKPANGTGIGFKVTTFLLTFP